jgi:hypothetical protein
MHAAMQCICIYAIYILYIHLYSSIPSAPLIHTTVCFVVKYMSSGRLVVEYKFSYVRVGSYHNSKQAALVFFFS